MSVDVTDSAVPAHSSVPAAGDATVVATGDIVMDSALRDLAGVDPSDLDGQIEAAEALQQTLQSRLAGLGE